MTATSEPVLAYRAKDAVEASALATYLEAEGIEPHVLGEYLQGAYAGVTAGGMNAPEVWICAGDFPRAKSLIAEWHERHAADAAADVTPTREPKFQYSTASLLWLMTIVAVLATAIVRNWLVWIYNLFVIALVLFVAINSARRAHCAVKRGMADVPEPDSEDAIQY